MPDAQAVTVWLAVLAMAAALQTLILLAAAIGVVMVYRRTARALDRLERTHLAPVSARASLVMDEIQDVTARARRMDETMRAKIQGVEVAAREVRHAVIGRLWPVVGVARAVGAGMRAFSSRTPTPVATRGGATTA